MKKIFSLGFIVLICLSSLVQAVDITKTCSHSTISPGDIVTITIKLENDKNSILKGTIYDLPPKFAGVLDVDLKNNHEVVLENGTEATLWDIETPITFNVSLDPSEFKSYEYRLNFSSIPDPIANEQYTLPIAYLQDSNGNEYDSNQLIVQFASDKIPPCNYNLECEEGENYENCLNDCLSGYEDNLCDGLTDKRCDPDCPAEEDPDCVDPIITEWPYIGEIKEPVPDDVKEETETKTVQDTLSGQSQQDNTLIYVILILIAIAVIYVIYTKKVKK